jgi:HD-GYP domain-containing protein (c-di-GMP phosphodiesterase class II)
VLFRELDNLPVQFVSSLVSTLDARDPCTRGHSERVAGIARRIGEEIGLSERELSDLYQSGLLHDIGKIGIQDAILQKEGRLTPEEFEEVRQHPEIGFRILSGLKNLRSVLPGVRSHHENYAGDGYPDGLIGESIPLMARILGVADAYDAMRSDRPYRRGMPVFRIEELFRADSGRQWDPSIIDAYFQCRDEIYELGRSGTRSAESPCLP